MHLNIHELLFFPLPIFSSIQQNLHLYLMLYKLGQRTIYRIHPRPISNFQLIHPYHLTKMAPVQRSIASFFTSAKSQGNGTSKTATKDTITKKHTKDSSTSDDEADLIKDEVEHVDKRVKTEEAVDLKQEKSKVEEANSIESHKIKNQMKDAEDLLKLEKQVSPLLTNSDKDKPIMYAELAEVFDELENESGRLKNLAIASEFFTSVLKSSTNPSKDLVQITYLMINRLGPDYEPDLELGLGETLLIKALAQGTGRELASIRKEYKEVGDIGVVAEKSRSKQSLMFKPKPLNVNQVFQNLSEIAKSTGASSQNRKMGIINKMLTACQGKEAKFLMRSLEGKLRINFGEKSVLVALSKALLEFEYYQKKKKVTPELLVEAEQEMKLAFSQTPNYEIVIREALDHGVLKVSSNCGLNAGVPLKPMLAKPTKAISDILDQFEGEEFTCEYKYDGERAQLHLLSNGELRIYSRNSENMTERYPDLIDVVKKIKELNPGIKNLILDCECVAWDREKEKILPFQVLSTRKRKDVQANEIKVQVCLFAFDILLFNDEPLITTSLKERRAVMKGNLQVIPGSFQYAVSLDSSDVNDIQKFLDQSVKDACEGLMIKSLNGKDSYYEPSKRSRNWLKLKKDYLDGVGDSLDLIVIGGYTGKGKRTGWYGGFLLGSYNQDTGEIESICKIGTGFTEEMFQKLTDDLKPTEIAQPKTFYVYNKDTSSSWPDVWFEPTTIFEVKVADFTTSPIYKSGATYLGDGEKGISLRFPRFIQIRDDKSIEDATSSEQIVDMFSSQANGAGA